MPHDRYGRKIDLGDTVVAPALNHQQPRVAGVVVQMTESQTCTGQMHFLMPGKVESDYFNADDAELVLKANGELPAPAALEPSSEVDQSQATL